MRKISARIRNYFAFSQTETRGAVLLLFFTLSMIAGSAFLSARMTHSYPTSDNDRRTLDSLVAVLEQVRSDKTRPDKVQPVAFSSEQTLALFPFDPNVTDSATFTQLGLTPWIAQRVLRYREKGGVFHSKADFKKIYGLPEATYYRLYDYMQLPEKAVARKKATGVTKPRKTASLSTRSEREEKNHVISLDINIADTTLLKQLPGIGSTLSARIVKYRQKLGGYHHINQLQEVYHMTDLGVASLQKRAYVAEGNRLHKLNINRSDAKTLAQHPYISWDLARALVKHRQDYGEFRTLDDVQEVYLMTEKVFEKIAPYLEI